MEQNRIFDEAIRRLGTRSKTQFSNTVITMQKMIEDAIKKYNDSNALVVC